MMLTGLLSKSVKLQPGVACHVVALKERRVQAMLVTLAIPYTPPSSNFSQKKGIIILM